MTTAAIYHAAAKFWQAYLEQGPGKLQPSDLAEFRLAAQAESTRFASPRDDCDDCDAGEPAWERILELEELFLRCVHRSEGLCFVTGEAGLIPRKDLHERVESILALLKSTI